MRRVFLVFFLVVQVSLLSGQIVLTIEGQEYDNAITGLSNGINIARSQPTIFTFRNNSITSVNAQGYMLQAGDEVPAATNNNLDGEVITGNIFTWNGTDESSMTHALFTGYNLNAIIKFNYLNKTPNGIQRKSNGMSDISGVVAYNIIINPRLGIAVKGINGIKIYNNTFYSDKTLAQTNRGLVDIHKNLDDGLDAASTGTKVFNNIFYTRNRIFNIKIQESACLEGFESDYNVFWCESGEPLFEIGGQTKTFAQWQALGYDLHSVVADPDFINFTDFVPMLRLDHGKDLGTALQAGLAIDAIWGATSPETTNQSSPWQAGARIYSESEEEIKIYPNPALNFFYVRLSEDSPAYNTLRVYDVVGRRVLTFSVEKGLNTVPIPKSFSSGIYNVVLEAQNLDRSVKKLIIIK